MTSGYICNRVASLSECSSAAATLGLSSTTASNDNQSGVSYDPPYCYFEGSVLKLNSNGLNTGPCTTTDQCICRKGKYSAYVDAIIIVSKL